MPEENEVIAPEKGASPLVEEEKKYSDKELDTIISKKKAKWEKEWKAKQDEAEKLDKMNAEERAKHREAQLQARIDELEKKEALSQMTKQARNMLSEAKINVSDEFLSILVTETAETTKTSVEQFVKLFNAHVEKEVLERLKGKTPTKSTGSSLSREQILNVKDRHERQRLIKENIHLFE